MARNNVSKPPIENPPKSVMEWLNLFSSYLQEIKGTPNYYDQPATTIKHLAEISEEVRGQLVPKYTSINEVYDFPVLMENTVKSEMSEFSIQGKTLAPYFASGRITKSGAYTDLKIIYNSGHLPAKFILPNKNYKLVVHKSNLVEKKGTNDPCIVVQLIKDDVWWKEKRYNLDQTSEFIVFPFTTPEDIKNLSVYVSVRDVTCIIDDYIYLYDDNYSDEFLKDIVEEGITSQNNILIETRNEIPNMIGNGAPYDVDKIIKGPGVEGNLKLVYDNSSPGSKYVLEIPVKRNVDETVLVEFPFKYSFEYGDKFIVSFNIRTNITGKDMIVGFTDNDAYKLTPTSSWQRFNLKIINGKLLVKPNLVARLKSGQVTTPDAKIWLCDIKVSRGEVNSPFCPSLLDDVNDGNSMTRLISLPNPICSLEDTIFDTLYYRNNKTHSTRNVLHVLLDGKEGWEVLEEGENTILFGTDKYDDQITSNNNAFVISDNFAYHKDCDTNDCRCIYQSTELNKIRIRMSRQDLPFQNEKGIEEWLKANNTNIYVQLRSSVASSEGTVGKLNFDVFDGQTYLNCLSDLTTNISASAPSNIGAFMITVLNSINKLINVSGDTITGDHKYIGCGSVFINKAENPLMGTSVGKTYSLYSRMTSEGIYLMEYKEEDSGEVLATIELGPDNFVLNSEKGYVSLRTKGNELIFDGDKGIYSVKRLSLGDTNNQFSEAYVNNMVMYGARLERPDVPEGLIGYMYDLNIHKPIWWNGTNWTDGLGTIL